MGASAISDIKYSVSARGYANIVGIGDYEGEILKIPSVIDGHKIYAVGEYAFSDNETLKLVMLDEGIKAIHSGAFSFASGIKKVYLPSTLSLLGDCAFVDSANIESIFFKRNKLITEIQRSTFGGLSALRRISLPMNLSVIGEYAFFKCTSLPEIELPSTMTRIEACAFLDCESLESITIPANVSYIGESAFIGCKNLKKIRFEESDGWYANGKRIKYEVLYNSESAAKLFTNAKAENISFKRIDQPEWI